MSDLPEGWVATTLGDLGRWSSGGTPSKRKSEYYGGNIPWVRTGDLRDNEIFDVEGRISPEGLANSSAKEFPSGTLLIAMYGATIGRTGMLRIPATTNQACAALLPDPVTEDMMPFLWWFFRHKVEDFRAVGQGGAQPNISQTVIKASAIDLPPLPEQRRIVAKLDRLSARSAAARDHLARTTKLATRAKQTILGTAFRGMLARRAPVSSHGYFPDETLAQVHEEHLNFWISSERTKRAAKRQSTDLGAWTKKYTGPARVEDHEVPFDLPDDWRWVSAEEIVQPGAEIVYGIVQPGPKLDKGVPYVRGMDIVDGVIQIEQLLKTSPEIAERYSRASLAGGDVLLGIIRATKVAIVPNEISGANITQGTARFRPSRFIRTRFLARWLESPDAQNWLHSKYRGIDMPGLNLRDVRRCPVPLAPLEVQDEIVRRIEAAFARIDRMTEEASRAAHLLDRLDERLLAKAFRGELVPQDPEDEPAEALLTRIRESRAAAPQAKRGRRRKAEA